MNKQKHQFSAPLTFIAVLMASFYCCSIQASTKFSCIENPSEKMIWIEGGEFVFGSDDAYREEAKAERSQVDSFWISAYEVTNQQFKEFVDSTGYVTQAERTLSKAEFPDIPDEQRQPGSVVFVPPVSADGRLLNWWQFVAGANWLHPEGPNSTIQGKENHPVVHIAYEDALAYATWKGHDLPTEQEWEYVAKSKRNTIYAWGKELTPGGEYRANTWQGIFPIKNSSQDGFVASSPVGCYEPNDYGVYDMIGNVWEWTSSFYYPGHQYTNLNETYKNGFDPNQKGVAVRTIKGGSFLCAPNHCKRYRPSARHAQDLSLGTSHLGFRTVKRNQTD